MFEAVKIPTYIFTVGSVCRFFQSSMQEGKKEDEFLGAFAALCAVAWFLARFSLRATIDDQPGGDGE